jgi:hypothetical protein
MRTLPKEMRRVLAPFAPLFSERVFQHVKLLLAGAILAPGRRTVASALRAVGLEHERRFCRYHRVLSRAVWSSREASRVFLLGLLIEAFVPDGGPLVFGIDETLERRQGKKISAKGIYRDPVRSSREHFVKTSALRWVCLALLVPVPWTSRVWSLPFLSALAYSERYAQERGKKRHKTLTDWAWQLLLLVRRWYPEREIVAVADGGYASLKLLARCRRLSNPITFITRLRLDAALYEPAQPRYPAQMGRTRLKGERLPNLSAVAEDPAIAWTSITIADWYGRGGFCHGGLVQHGASARSVTLGPDPRSQGGVRNSGLAVHRSPRRPCADHRLVRKALADGGHFSRGASAPGVRDSEALVRAGGPKDRSGAVGVVLCGYVTCPPAKGTDSEDRKAGSVVRQEASDLLRCLGTGAQAVVDARSDFLRVASAGRHGKSPKGICGTANRCGLLRSLMAKV